MILMVTNRRIRNGEYGDEEQPNYGYHYLSGYKGGPRGADGFENRNQKAFTASLLRGIQALKAGGVNTPKVGIYLHGYNNDWQESIDEIVDLHKALTPVIGYEPILIGFSWPSSGNTVSYLSDREEVRDSVPAFTRFLRDINDFLTAHERDCFSTSFCIAHSMGNYLLRKGTEYLSDYIGTPIGRTMFTETVMLAPDLASHDIELDGKARYVADFSRRVHVYYSRHDRAVKASSAKRFGGNRLGRHGANNYENLAANVVVVDAALYANSEAADLADLRDRTGIRVSVHSSHRYHPNILADIAHVLSSVDRNLITTRKAVNKIPERPEIDANHFELI